VVTKSRPIAVLLSAVVCPGAGQVYKRHYIRGAALIFMSLAVVAAIVYRTWTTLMSLMLDVPPDEMMMDVMGLTHRVLESQAVFFTYAGYAFLVLWVAGVIDAALTRPASFGNPDGPGD
jgi:hypothetical protein